MSLSILTNLPAINARRHINQGNTDYFRALERVASGKRINQPGDDAAGLAISTGLTARIRSISQAERNAEDAKSMIQVASGSMEEIANVLVRMRELAVQAASDTVGEPEREMINMEAAQLIEEVDRIAESTTYLGTHLLNGEGDDFQFQVGADANEFNQLSYSADSVDLRAGTLGVDGIDLTDRDSALSALEAVDEGITALHLPQAQLGAVQNRMQSTINSLQNYHETLSAANSRILDADLAQETAEVARGQIQHAAGVAVLSQANQIPSLALRLIG